MSRWLDPADQVTGAVTAFAREVADPVRLTVLQLLAAEGPRTMSEMADFLELPAPLLGNHLARLRAAELVTVQRTGRHAVYRIAHPRTAEALDALSLLAGDIGAASHRDRVPSPLALAHTCYGHIAGRLGVGMFTAAVQRAAILPPDPGRTELELGASATDYFSELGVDLASVQPGRRKLAAACLDWLERRPHLAGALGDAVLGSFLRQGLVTSTPGSRVLALTSKGRKRLHAFLGEDAA
jgi:DNA-binding transcriptional ArsR family regulator